MNQTVWYHYDFPNDVLYLRLVSERATETVAEEDPDGILLLRRADNDALVGLTIVDWWQRFGTGSVPDSIRELERHIEPSSRRLAS